MKKYKLYNVGVEALNKQFDIIQLVKKIRILNLMSSTSIFKYQKFLLPYFKRNLIEEYSRKQKKKKTQDQWTLQRKGMLKE